MARRTKIVATIGPASSAPEVLDALITAGVDVVRLNLSHGPVDEHLARVTDVRAAAERVGRPVGVLADLPGPKIRCGHFGDRGVHLPTGGLVELRPGNEPSTDTVVHVDYPGLLADLHEGDTVVVGDGAISIEVEHVGADSALGRVVTGGRATGRPGFHIPSERLRLATPTDEDLHLAVRMAAAGVDFLAVSFVRSGADLQRVREVVGDDGPDLVAKIETVPAVANLEEILGAADVVMVARGDLGIEMPLEDVPHVQKRVIRSCVMAGVPVITATQMLESMINTPSPTRAEVSDVANAVFDGTDAVMLSGETAIGQDPAGVVATMARIAERAEGDADYTQWGGLMVKYERTARAHEQETPITRAVTHAAWQAAQDLEIAAILCHTRSGRTARSMARYRPLCRLVGLSLSPTAVNRMTMVWGVRPMVVKPSTGTDEMVWHVVETATLAGELRTGDLAVVLARSPDSPDDATDVLRVVRAD